MRAVLLSVFGDAEQLVVEEVPDPGPPGSGEVLIRTAAAAVNPVDLRIRSGQYAARTQVPLPMILGYDISGTVIAVGPDVTGVAVGDPVVAMSAQLATGRGTYAELVTLAADIIAPAPTSVPLVDAAALPLAALTADQALTALDLPVGARVMITGAVGSVGGQAVASAKLRGLEVVALIRADSDIDDAHELGADSVVVGSVRGLVVDGLLETAGVTAAIEAVRDGGRVVSIVPANVPVAERGITVQTSFVQQSGADLARLVKRLDAGALRLRRPVILGFEQAAEAHRMLASGGVRGKILLVP